MDFRTTPTLRTRLVVAATAAVLAGAYVPVAVPILVPDLERAFAVRAGAVGALLSAGMAGGLVGGLLSGWLADRVGRLRVLRWWVLVNALGAAVCAAGTGYWALTLGLVAFGFGSGGVTVAWGGLLSVLFPDRRRAAFSGLLVTSASAGIALPYLVTWLQSLEHTGRLSFAALIGLPFGAVAGLLLAVAAVLATVRGVEEASAKSETTPGEPAAERPVWGAAEIAAVAALVLLSTLHGTADGVLSTWIARYLTDGFTRHPFPPGWVLSFYSLAYLAGRTGLLFLPDRLGRRALLVLPGLIAGPVCLIGIRSGSFSVTAWTYVGAALLYGLEYPALMALASRRFPTRFATVYGLMNLSTIVTIGGVWAVGRWTEAAGSMVPALSTAACGFIAFGVVAGLVVLSGAGKNVSDTFSDVGKSV